MLLDRVFTVSMGKIPTISRIWTLSMFHVSLFIIDASICSRQESGRKRKLCETIDHSPIKI